MLEYSLKRPGGLMLTEQLIAQTDLHRGDCLIDVGCGRGATVRLLREQYDLNACGIDCRWHAEWRDEPCFRRGRAEKLADYYPANSIDAIISECCLSLFDDAKLFLNQAAVVLREKGWLLLSDLYRSPEGTKSGSAADTQGGIFSEDQLQALLRSCGFALCSFQDQRSLLRQWLGQGILEMGREEFYRRQGWDAAMLPEGTSRLSYYSLVARKAPWG